MCVFSHPNMWKMSHFQIRLITDTCSWVYIGNCMKQLKTIPILHPTVYLKWTLKSSEVPSTWENNWKNQPNKLQLTKSNLNDLTKTIILKSRDWATINRICLHHSKTTHMFLFTRQSQSTCSRCNNYPFTIKPGGLGMPKLQAWKNRLSTHRK